MKTKTMYFTIGLLFAMASQSFAQNSGVLLNPFIGIGGMSGSDTIQTPSFGASAEFFLDETFSVGAMLTYSTLEAITTFGNQDGTTSGITIGGLANYYWTDSDNFNFYTGAGLGYDGHSGPYTDGTFYYEVHAGGRYVLSESLSLYSELGFGLALLKVGVSFKL